MTATISLVDATHPDGLTDASGRMQVSIDGLDAQIVAQQRALTELAGGWHGAAASAAAARGEQNLRQQHGLRMRLATLRSALGAAGTNLTALRSQVLTVAAQARTLGGLVGDDGTVRPSGRLPLLTPAVTAAYTTTLHGLLYQFDAFDEATAQTISRVIGGIRQAPPIAPPTPGIESLQPPAGASDTDVNQWWDRLSDEQRERLIYERPEWIGNLDGVPVAARDRANRNRLDDLARQHLTGAQRATLAAINEQLVEENGKAVPDRQLLLVDFDHDKPRVAIGIGDVEHADHVSVLVPGTGAVPYDKPNSGNDLPSCVAEATALKNRTEEILGRTSPGQTAAVVVWIGYRPPSNLATAGLPGYADDAAPQLASFVNGLDSSHDTEPHLTVIGHSYGSVVASEALQRGTAADDVIFTGSPGLETNPLQFFSDPTPAKFHLTEGHVFVEQADNDPVANIGRFGVRIVSALPGFIDLSTNAESTPLGPTIAARGHSEYFHTDTTALYNQAVVVAGQAANLEFVRAED